MKKRIWSSRAGAVGSRVCRLRRLLVASIAFAPLAAARQARAGSTGAGPMRDRLVLYVPSTEGGGWEQTALVMKQALETEGLVREVVIVRRPGGGGLVGLTAFVEARRGDPRYLLVGGNVMIHAAKANKSAVSLLDTTPIARLTDDYLAIAVPGSSSVSTLDDLLAVLQARPEALHWIGGVAGGTDEQLARRFAAIAGVDPQSLAYVPKAGAGEVATALQVGDSDLVGVAAYGELAPYAAGGRIRLLAVAAPGTTFGGVPTFRAAGLDLVSVNWRGVFGPPGLAPGERRQLTEMISQMTKSRIWREALGRRGWIDRFLTGEDFEAAIADEQQRVFANGGPGPSRDDGGEVSRLVALRYWPAGVAAVAIPLVAALVWRERRATRRERELNLRLAAIDGLEPAQPRPDGQSSVVAAIQREFDAWKLSAAERDVAWFLLKGLPMKEIARLRGASERTVRQQAQAIYGKSGLEGRSDLAAHILDHCLMSTTDAPSPP